MSIALILENEIDTNKTY